jgi:hypothetical protein
MGCMAECMPVKNTFIHFNTMEETPPVLGRVRTTPARIQESRPSCVEEKSLQDAVMAKPKTRWSDIVDEEEEEAHTTGGGCTPDTRHSDNESAPETDGTAQSPLEPQTGRQTSTDSQETQQKRRDWIEAVMKTEGYIRYMSFLERRRGDDVDALNAPETPDPCAPSKRQYEKQAVAWRTFLRKFGEVKIEVTSKKKK